VGLRGAAGGAHNVMPDCWEVSNASTPQLMDEQNKGSMPGRYPATAMRKAKLPPCGSTRSTYRSLVSVTTVILYVVYTASILLLFFRLCDNSLSKSAS
jgi:hypothetical protein